MSKEAENLLKAITDLATRLSDEWCRKSDAETKGLDLNEIYDKQATALIDAAFAKVREECAERARAKARAIRHANTYRGKVNMTAEQSAVFIEDLADDMEHAILGKEITCSKD